MGQPVDSTEKTEARESVSASTQVADETLLKDAFSAWAEVYDLRQNPLLALEERYLLRLLPRIKGRDVLDVGCGTGRWLAQLSQLNLRTLHGMDFSQEMLSKAAARHIPNTQLSLAPCTELPIENASIDVLLASFVLSYVDDLSKVAQEFARVVRPQGNLVLTDMHPETAVSLHWERAFSTSEAKMSLPARHRSIEEIVKTFSTEGFIVRTIIEPSFGLPEKGIFAAHDKIDYFAEAEHLPAIYLLHLFKSPVSDTESPLRKKLLYRGQCAVGPHEKTSAALMTNERTVETINSRVSEAMARSGAIDLSGYLLFPGLLNAHDHLEFALFPKLGRGHYQNATQWAQNIQKNDADVIALHRRVPKRTRLWWGGIRNLLSGVTTVCHHNPIDPCLLERDFPVRAISHFGWEHSLAFAGDVKAAHDNTPESHPFIIHACEGIDEGSSAELRTLDELGVLDQRTVIVHGLALDEDGIVLLNTRGSSLIACPSSNQFLFGKAPSQQILNSVTRLALGSDSSLTATGDLLDEIRFAVETCRLTPQRLYSLVMDSPSSILHSENGGQIRPGSLADLIAVRDRNGDPAEVLCSLSANDIELVLLEGRVQLASEPIFEKLSQDDREGLEPLSIDGSVRWLRAPIDNLLREAEDVLGKSQVRLGGRLLCRP
ncbi:methyltransferase domain-containing protein [Alloacidobacterium sp.]|uniref:methyltransferase domain-containing protein n=1 Tax=Alloacidobacterium sp. TaxID=2951999 RepID=UPI002D674357|nr:methyltransferase domain-containing protein [Alloacidobacterium sp.]HYK35155.1 methyltransferase domain-containing protein [Alloacidobacterium sp.]